MRTVVILVLVLTVAARGRLEWYYRNREDAAPDFDELIARGAID